MGFSASTARSKTSSSSSSSSSNTSDGWGLGLLLVFFPDDDKKKLFTSSSSSSSFKSSTNSTTHHLFSRRAQSTISILCIIIVFFTLLFTLFSTLDPTLSTNSSSPRRFLYDYKKLHLEKFKKKRSSSHALQGMGSLFRRGTRAMSDLIVAHLDEDTKTQDVRLFLRTLHRSGVSSRSDLVFIFPSHIHSSTFSTIIQQENQSFLKLVSTYNDTSRWEFVKTKEKQSAGEAIWGGAPTDMTSRNSTELNWGSVVGFEADELDPEDSLSGFFERVPMRLRRWACYPMLLGRVRRNFKHIMLGDVKNVIILGDELAHIRGLSAESVYLRTEGNNVDNNVEHKHGRKKLGKTELKLLPVTADVITGGMRGMRRLSEAMLNQIVRNSISTQHKSKNLVSDSSVLSQLVQNNFLVTSRNIDINIGEQPLRSTTSSFIATTSLMSSTSKMKVVYRGGNKNVDVNYILHTQICSSTLHSSSVYSDC